MSDISKYDYEHAQKVWKEFKLKNLGEYPQSVSKDALAK